MTQEELNEQFTHKIQKGIFRPVDRFISNRSEAEDTLQDAICSTWATYSKYATERGEVLDDALLVHACRLRAIDPARRFVGANGAMCRNQDVMDPRVYQSELATVLRLDWDDVDEGHDGRHSQEVGLAREVADDPEPRWISALDLQAWVGDQCFQDQGILSRKMEGHTTKELAHEIHLPYLVTWRKEKALGADLAARAGVLIKSRGKRCGRPRKQNEAA